MKKISLLLLATFLLSLSSCRDVVELDVEAAPPELVLNGTLSNSSDLKVQLQSTAGFFDNQRFPSISGARVSLLEDGQEVTILTESDSLAGHYHAPFRGSFNRAYQLRVEISGDYPEKVQGVWLSSIDTLRPVPSIDSLKQAKLNRNTTPQAFFEGDYALMYFGDFPGKGDYYRIKRRLNDSAFAQDVILLNDEDFDGFYFGQGLFPPIAIYGPFEEPENGEDPDSLIVELQSIPADLEDYLTILQSQVQTGSPFDAPPAFVIGNIYKEDAPETFAFGYFKVVGSTTNGIRYRP